MKNSVHRKLFVGPMSKNVVDAVINDNELSKNVGIIPSRRQIEFDGGYVNHWTTDQFLKYTKRNHVIRCRDHAGPLQGSEQDDGLTSLEHDCSHEDSFELIHIDPWKNVKSINDAIDQTCTLIMHCVKLNEAMQFEIGTEQGIFPYSSQELETFIIGVKSSLGESFKKIVYCVVQGGTLLRGNENKIGINEMQLREMVEICGTHDLLSKEHNGDYLSYDLLKARFEIGLDSINVAPEFGYNETKFVMSKMCQEDFENFYKICYDSGKWKKWLPKDFKVASEKEKRAVINVSGHYVFTNEFFKKAKNKSGIADETIVKMHSNNMKEMLKAINHGQI